MISNRSRYVRDSVSRVAGRDGILRSTIVPRTPNNVIFNYTYYSWVEGNRIDLLAYAFFNDPTRWWIIADANPEVFLWDELPSGTVIRIPYA